MGTTFAVEDLFCNAPVRRKFLKKPAAEAAARRRADVPRLILSQAGRGLPLRRPDGTAGVPQRGGRQACEAAVDERLRARGALKQLTRKVSGDDERRAASPAIVGAGDARPGQPPASESFFRQRARLAQPALLSGARGGRLRADEVMVGRFPMCALHFWRYPYEQVDVNVHPNKLGGALFQNERGVRRGGAQRW